MISSKDLQKKVRKVVSERRFEHIIGVKDTAACLAMRYDVDLEKTLVAALLHDYCKDLSDKEMLSEAKRRGIPVSKTEQKNPYLLHGKLAASYGKEKFDITNEDILGAVTWHTTGKPNMSLLEMIIFTADYIEPNRRMIPGLEEIRAMAFLDLEETVYLINLYTIRYLESTVDPASIDDHTYETFEYYKYLHNSKKGA